MRMNLALLTIFAIHLVSGDVNEKKSLAISRVPSNFPGLEAPFEGSATSPQRRRIISTHHNEDDENNLERLCNDPFHSFLCKPVGPRKKRIDGRLRPGVVLPPGAVAAASNLREEKQPLEEGSALLPASLDDDRMYLPPLSKPPPILKSEAQYLPPEESKPNIESVPSSHPNFYLPVFDTTQQPPDKVKNSVNQEGIKKYISSKPPTISYLPTDDKLLNPAEVQLSPFSTNQDEVKVPQNIFDTGDESKPDNTELIPNIEGGSLLADEIKPNSNNDKESHTLERLCNDPFHSFLCKPVKKRKRIDGNIRQGAKLPTNFLLGSSSIRTEARVLPPNVGRASLSPNTPSNNYIAFNSYKSQAPGEQNPFQQVYNEYSKQREPTKHSPQYSTQSPLLYSYSFQNNGHSVTANTKLPYYKNSSGSSDSTHDNDQLNRQYYKDSATHLQNGYYYSLTSQPDKIQYALSTNDVKKSQADRQAGLQQSQVISSNQKRYIYQEPTAQYTFTNTYQPYEGKQSIIPHNQQPNPTNIQQRFINPQQNGYQYNQPQTIFTYPTTSFSSSTSQTTNILFEEITTIKPTIIEQNPTNIQPTFVNPQQNGYQYNKPSTLFTYPTKPPRPPTAPTTRAPYVQTTTIRPVTIPTSTTRKPVIIQQNPTNIQPTFVNPQQNGYQYNKPSTLFTYPTTPPRAPTAPTTRAPYVQTTTIRPVTIPTSTTRKPVIIQQNPTNIQQTFVNPQQNGYQYNKPSTLFTYPTTPPRAPTAPTTRAPYVQTTTIRPVTIPTSTTRKPVIIQQNPTNIQQTFVNPQQNGYQYNEPSTLFTYPTTPPRAPTAPTTRAPYVQTTIRPVTIPTSTTRKPVIIQQNPTNIQPTFVNPQQNGYQYNKPSTLFTYPTTPPRAPTAPTTRAPYVQTTTIRPVTFPTSTTRKPVIIQQNPTNVQPTFVNPQQNGYQYNKPSTLFTYPTSPPRAPTAPTTRAPYVQTTTIRPVTIPTSTTRKPVIIQQNPTNIQPTFVNPQQNGYQYNKPSTLFTYPTTPPRAPTAPTTRAPYVQTTTIRPVTLPTSTTRNPVIIQQNPTNIQPTFVNPQQNGYQYNKPSTLFTYPTTPPRAPTAPTTRAPFIQTTTIRPVTIPASTTRKPVIIQQNPTNIQPTFVNPQQNGYQYNKPSTLFTYPTTPPRAPTAPTTRAPYVQTTTIRPVTFPTSTTRKPVIIQQNPTNIQPTFVNLQQNGYQYNKPSTLFTYPTTPPRAPPAPTTRAPFIQTTTIRPVTIPTSTTRKPVIIQQNPTNIQPTFVNPQQNGYQYNKPSTLFTYPTTPPRAPTAPTTRAPYVQTTTIRPVTFPTSTTRKPVIIQQNPTNIQPTFVNPQQNGYQYNKPSTLFTYPTTPPRAPTAPTTRAPFIQTTTIRPVTIPTSTTRKPVIIQQNPTNIQPTFVNPQQNGYQYNKPSTLFTYPTTPPRAPTAPTTRAPYVQTTTIRPVTFPTSTTRKPVIIQQNPTNIQPTFVNPQQNGYQYNKPSTLFTYPTTPPRAPTAPTTRAPFIQTTTIRPVTLPTSTTRKPVIIQQNPTNIQQTFVNPLQNGYQYNKPSTLFTYPTTTRRAPSLDATQQRELRFGERLKPRIPFPVQAVTSNYIY